MMSPRSALHTAGFKSTANAAVQLRSCPPWAPEQLKMCGLPSSRYHCILHEDTLCALRRSLLPSAPLEDIHARRHARRGPWYLRKSAVGTSITRERTANHGCTTPAPIDSPLRARTPPRIRDQRAAPPRGGAAAVALSPGVWLPSPGPKLPGVGPQRPLPRARRWAGAERGAWRRSRPLAASARRHRRSNSPRGAAPIGRGEQQPDQAASKKRKLTSRAAPAALPHPDYRLPLGQVSFSSAVLCIIRPQRLDCRRPSHQPWTGPT